MFWGASPMMNTSGAETNLLNQTCLKYLGVAMLGALVELASFFCIPCCYV